MDNLSSVDAEGGSENAALASADSSSGLRVRVLNARDTEVIREGCSSQDLARYRNAKDEDVIFEMQFVDAETGESKVATATAGMLREVISAIENDQTMQGLLANYWSEFARNDGHDVEQKIQEAWTALAVAFDRLLLGLFGAAVARGFVGVRLRMVAMHIFSK
ncbi:hypothetical protein [Rhizobium sp. YTU87027]|uniref:hypothetical protein n=1 Tax=Rhizobium sp. YTU87027 TaxID=3417741 RepID=UPI003D68C0B4